MKYFFDPSVGVRAFESDDSQDFLITPDMRPLTAEELEAHINPPAPVYVPLSVTMRQARLALHAAGLLSQVEAAIDALPEPPRSEARIEWDYSSEVFRERDFVVMLAGALELTDEQIDGLFIAAAAL